MGRYVARSVAARPPEEEASWVEIQRMAAEGTALAGSADDAEAAAAAEAEADMGWHFARQKNEIKEPGWSILRHFYIIQKI